MTRQRAAMLGALVGCIVALCLMVIGDSPHERAQALQCAYGAYGNCWCFYDQPHKPTIFSWAPPGVCAQHRAPHETGEPNG